MVLEVLLYNQVSYLYNFHKNEWSVIGWIHLLTYFQQILINLVTEACFMF